MKPPAGLRPASTSSGVSRGSPARTVASYAATPKQSICALPTRMSRPCRGRTGSRTRRGRASHQPSHHPRRGPHHEPAVHRGDVGAPSDRAREPVRPPGAAEDRARAVEFLEHEEAEALYLAAEAIGAHWRTLIELGTEVGLRPGEIYGLHGHRVDCSGRRYRSLT